MKQVPRILLRTLGSMDVAIILLLAVAVSSVIGTLLKQNEPYQNYIIKFGPFWHQFYKTLGLYDVYSSLWFITVLGFLVASTSICIFQHTPAVLRTIRNFRLNLSRQSLLAMPQQEEGFYSVSAEDAHAIICQHLKRVGYRFRSHLQGEQYTVAAMKGACNRLGYLSTHIAIVVICIGGLLDGNLPLKFKLLTSQLRLEKENDKPIALIPASSRLTADNSSFRGNVSIAEGKAVNIAFLNVADGYLIQELPFAIEVLDFHIEHYLSGQPKSFASDLLIHDPQEAESFAATITVNNPLRYKGLSIYQSSFSDGGSSIDIRLHPFGNVDSEILELSSQIGKNLLLEHNEQNLILEFDDFRLFNIFASDDQASGKKFDDRGPSLTFKIRQQDGSAREFINYMYPIKIDERYFFLSGIRNSPDENFSYLHIPADENQSLNSFLRFQALLHDQQAVKDVTQVIAQQAGQLSEELAESIITLVNLFKEGGFEAIQNHLSVNVPREKRAMATEIYMNMLQAVLQKLYLKMLSEENLDISENTIDARLPFLQDLIAASSALPYYEAPFFLELQDFEHKQATGLQITRTPGKKYVYLGFTMLIAGIFLLFYTYHQRIWILIEKTRNGSQLIIAGKSNRQQHKFSEDFDKLSKTINTELSAADKME